MRPQKAPWAHLHRQLCIWSAVWFKKTIVYFYHCGYCCQLPPGYWSVRSTKSTQSYHSITTDVYGIFCISPSYPETSTCWWMLPHILPLFICSVDLVDRISTLARKLLLLMQNFLKMKACCPLALPRKVYCSITAHIKFKCTDMFTVRAAAQIGWAVAILLQSWAEKLTLACCSHALPSSGFTLTQWHPARHKVYLHNTKSWDEPLFDYNVDRLVERYCL